MKQRIISGALLVAILIPTLLLGDYVTGVVLALVSLVGIYELLKVFHLETSIPGIITYIIDVIYFALMILIDKQIIENGLTDTFSFMVITVLFFICLLIVYVITFPKYKALEIMSCLFIFVYAGVLLSYVYRIRSLEAGVYLVWVIFIASWICDTCAYFSGVFLGKHKAFPVLSPKKTWEGCIGGVIGSVLVALLFAIVFSEQIDGSFGTPRIALPVIVFVCSIISMFGDLAASAIKRDYEIKDYGTLIPGHGGIMDRFDSVIFVAPVVYYMILLLK
ncbi:MAG: phosphatidate cytidylyltransferase [Lachnospiraceae bacterium]|nr:phosphatidate cytidylyltransferase [Lachnospiraceae bacterium]